MFNWLETSVDKRLVPFVAILVIVAVFAFTWTVWAEEPPKAVIYRGPGGSYVQQPGEVVQQFENGRLLVTRTDGSQFYIDLTAKVAAPSAKYETRYKPNGQPYRVLVQSQATEMDIALAEHDLRVQESEQNFALESAEVAQKIQNDKHDNNVDLLEQGQSWYEKYQQSKEQKTRSEQNTRYEKQRRQERTRNDILGAVDNAADRAERIRRRIGDRVNDYIRSQN